MILRPRTKAKNTVDSGAGVGARAYGDKNIFYARDGVQVRERKLGDRILYSSDALGRWMHPWYTTVGWFTKGSGALKNNRGEAIAGFAAVVNPGFVNGLDPVCPGSQKIKVGEEKTSSDLLSGGDPQDVLAEPGLLDGPLIPLFSSAFKVMERAIPAGLADLGGLPYSSGATVSGSFSSGTMALQLNSGNTENPRYVAQTAIYLQCARPTHKMEVQLPSDPLLGEPVQFNIMYDFAMLDLIGVRARLMTGALPQKPNMLNVRRGIEEDMGMDLCKIATVYFLSPENPELGERGPKITEAWVPYVKHHTFWNLEYRWKSIAPNNRAQIGSDLSLLPILGRFTVAPLATKAAMDSQINEVTAGLFNATVPEGRFWVI
jgi:hypothetical protein